MNNRSNILNYEYGLLHWRPKGSPKQEPYTNPKSSYSCLLHTLTVIPQQQNLFQSSRSASQSSHIKPAAIDLKSLLALDTETVWFIDEALNKDLQDLIEYPIPTHNSADLLLHQEAVLLI